MARLLILILVFGLLGNSGEIYGQIRTKPNNKKDNLKNEHIAVWRKRVIRRLYTPSSKNTEEYNRWSAFLTLLIHDCKSIDTKCYTDDNFGKQLTKNQIDSFFTTKYHYNTTVFIEPVSGNEILKIDTLALPFDSGRFIRLKICEEWAFDLSTGKTTINIIGIAPVYYSSKFNFAFNEDIRNEIWIKWEKFSKYYSINDVCKSIVTNIWKDYFKDSGIVKETIKIETDKINHGVFEGTAIRKIWLLTDFYDNNNIKDFNLVRRSENPPSEILCKAILNGVIPAFNEPHWASKNLTVSEIIKRFTGPEDTVKYVDPGCGIEHRFIKHEHLSFENINKYFVQEHWEFDPVKGQTEINLTWIAPLKDNQYEQDRKTRDEPLFWIHFNDCRSVLSTYREYNPTFTLEWRIWMDRFIEQERTREKD